MNIEFVPTVCLGDQPSFEGSLVVRLPSAEERCDYMAESNISFGDAKDETKSQSFLRPMGLLIRKSYDHIIKVDMKKKSDGKKIKSIDDLKYDPDCFSILTELAGKLLNGFVVGKN